MTPSINHRRAVRYAQRSTADLWVTAIAASKIVGRREPGATAALAADCFRSVDRVEGWARAAVLYLALRNRMAFARYGCADYQDDLNSIRDCRRQLTISHWEAVSKEWVKQDFTLYQCLRWLQEALNGGWSVEQLREHMSRTEPKHLDFPGILGNYYERLMREAEKWGGAEGEVLQRLAAQFDEARAALVKVTP